LRRCFLWLRLWWGGVCGGSGRWWVWGGWSGDRATWVCDVVWGVGWGQSMSREAGVSARAQVCVCLGCYFFGVCGVCVLMLMFVVFLGVVS